MKLHVSLILLIAVLLLPAAAADFELTYLDGTLEIENANGLRTAAVGDAIPKSSTVHLAENSMAELVSPSVTLLLSREGSYPLAPLAEKKAHVQRSVGESIFSKISRMGGREEEFRSEAMGTRGAEAGEAGGMQWVDEESLAFEEALSAYSAEEYEQAATILEEQVDPSMLDDPTTYWYYLASSYLLTDREAKALQIASGFCGSRESGSYEEYLLLRARLYVEALDFRAAAQLYGTYLELASTPESRQWALYMFGYSLLQSGEREEALVKLQSAVDIDADPEITRASRELIE